MIAVPLVDGFEKDGSALDDFESFFDTLANNCTRLSGNIMVARIKATASALTITRTSFGSLARSTTVNPSPSATAQNPVVSATALVHSQNGIGKPHSDNASSKPLPSQALQSASDRPLPTPNPSPVAQSALDPPPLPAPVPTRISNPQPAGPKPPLIQHNANAPGKFDS